MRDQSNITNKGGDFMKGYSSEGWLAEGRIWKGEEECPGTWGGLCVPALPCSQSWSQKVSGPVSSVHLDT